MKKTIIYIDGYNLYYGLLKNNPRGKWLDLKSFVASLLRPDHEITAIKFFTARIRPYPYDIAAVERQKIYLQALSSIDKIQVCEGFYNKNKVWLPLLNEKCKSCSESRNGMARVVKFEEKRSDVNIAVSAMIDAARTDAECFVLITGDSDQVGTIEALRYEFGKKVLVFNPHAAVSDHLKRAASYYSHIPVTLPESCRLPDSIVMPNNRILHCPLAWM